jgi:hypothetical protein
MMQEKADAELMETRAAGKRATRTTSPQPPVFHRDTAAGRMTKPTGRYSNRLPSRPDLKTLEDQGVDKHLADRARKAGAKVENFPPF